MTPTINETVDNALDCAQAAVPADREDIADTTAHKEFMRWWMSQPATAQDCPEVNILCFAAWQASRLSQAQPLAEQVLYIRCMKHRDVPQLNAATVDGAECPICEQDKPHECIYRFEVQRLRAEVDKGAFSNSQVLQSRQVEAQPVRSEWKNLSSEEASKLRRYAELARNFMGKTVDIEGPYEAVRFLFYCSPDRILALLEDAAWRREALDLLATWGDNNLGSKGTAWRDRHKALIASYPEAPPVPARKEGKA